MTTTSGGATIDATARYIIAGWFEDHAGEEVRAEYTGALDIGSPRACLIDSGHRIDLGFDDVPFPVAALSLAYVEDAALWEGRLLLTLANGDDLDLRAV